MKSLLTLLVLTLFFQCSFAQKQSNNIDSTKIKKSNQNNLFIKLHSVNSYNIIKPTEKNYNFGSMFGTGAELIIGFKLQEKVALGFGFQRSSLFLNQASIESGLAEIYTQSWSQMQVSATGKSTLKQQSFLVYLSKWKQRKHAVLEYYTKLFLSSFQYHLNSHVRDVSDSSVTTFNSGISNTGFIAAAGINYSRQISKIFYVGAGVQYNYNLTPRTYMYEKNTATNGVEATYQVELPTPAHTIQMNIGIMYRPQKPCNCKKMGLNDIR